MALSVVSNFAANVAHRHLAQSDSMASNSVAKLSAGSRVLSAKDDAAALAIGSRLKAEVSSLNQASVNAGQAVSMLQIADGAMSGIDDILTRMKTLAVQSSSGQLSDTERGMLNEEFTSLRGEIDRIAQDTDFNGTQLLDGSNTFSAGTLGANIGQNDGIEQIVFTGDPGAFSATDSVTVAYNSTTDQFTVTNDVTGISYTSEAGVSAPSAGTFKDVTIQGAGLTIQLNSQFDDTSDITANNKFLTSGGTSNTLTLSFKVGTGTDSQDSISINLSKSDTGALASGLNTATIDTAANADSAISLVTTAIDTLAQNRAALGANQNRLEFAAANIATATENSEAARSALMDLDVASEMSKFTSQQILVQAGVSMLAQANQMPQSLMKLFQ
ncbi:flagellin [Tistlia consotensis]|uniref:Flagellin n=1 Tax=Tistlia consotensis USBA 355 TaxID=560819 RepID=A0A1Y6CJ43_9PROT|nr:flagellin [Tistlia consotensis]SMF67822.1 flagellin [Tistlia consotensis USBA 355]SNR99492.1 flagellin [Tistlia consotensis]